MKYVLWVVQVLLCLAFLGAGVSKLSQPYESLSARMVWVADVPEPLIRFIGLAETLGAVGLVLPAASRILPWLTPLAAAGLALDMLLATGFHLMRGELGSVGGTVVLLALAAFVAYGRRSIAPIRDRRATAPTT